MREVPGSIPGLAHMFFLLVFILFYGPLSVVYFGFDRFLLFLHLYSNWKVHMYIFGLLQVRNEAASGLKLTMQTFTAEVSDYCSIPFSAPS